MTSNIAPDNLYEDGLRVRRANIGGGSNYDFGVVQNYYVADSVMEGVANLLGVSFRFLRNFSLSIFLIAASCLSIF